jgi:hypothetical protein
MNVIRLDGIKGPYKDEGQFKAALLKAWAKEYPTYNFTLFEIENEEKEPGMPDVLAIHSHQPAYFMETKYIGKDGKIKFKPSQPRFYKTNFPKVHIQIFAWDSRFSRIVVMSPQEVIDAKKLEIKVPDELDDLIDPALEENEPVCQVCGEMDECICEDYTDEDTEEDTDVEE